MRVTRENALNHVTSMSPVTRYVPCLIPQMGCHEAYQLRTVRCNIERAECCHCNIYQIESGDCCSGLLDSFVTLFFIESSILQYTEAYTCHSCLFNFLFVEFNRGKIDFNLEIIYFNLGKINFKLGKINFKLGIINFNLGKIDFNLGKIDFNLGKI